MIHLKQSKNDEGRPLFIREGIIISDVKKKVRRTSGVLSLVIIEDKPLATLLGDSENPAHTQWQIDSSNFRNKYVYGKSYIDFVKNIVSDIVSALSAQEDELDENLLLGIFSLPAEEDEIIKREDKQKDNKPGTETEKVTLDLNSKERKFEIQQIAGGFQLKTGKAKLKPFQINIRCPIAFYSNDSQLSKRRTSFGYGKKSDFTQDLTASPAATKYIHRSIFDDKARGKSFGVSR